ncbi:MAG: glycosyltransferase family 9 protein, partial [Bdellovibrionales bacterium]|nr:glycosyltransferase family 9 protein [Bdellovibrionales bacterium]
GIVDEVIGIQKSDRKSYKKAINQLRNQTIDIIFCPHKSFRTALFVSSLKVRKTKVGSYRLWNFWAFQKRVLYPSHLPDALRQLSLLREVSESFRLKFDKEVGQGQWNNTENKSENIDFTGKKIPSFLKMAWPSESKSEILSSADKETVVLVPGSVWNTKRWTLEGYQTLAKRFVSEGWNVLLMGSKEEHELCEQVRKISPKIVNIAGQTTFKESLGLLQKANLLISNDSGSMHLGAIADIPTVAIFGPTTLEIGYRPWSDKAIVMQKDLECRPCGKHGHKECPIGTHACMKNISSDEVYEVAKKLYQFQKIIP